MGLGIRMVICSEYLLFTNTGYTEIEIQNFDMAPILLKFPVLWGYRAHCENRNLLKVASGVGA